MASGWKNADSRNRFRVVLSALVVSPPMMPPRPIGPESSVMHRTAGSTSTSCPFSSSTFSPLRPQRTSIAPERLVDVLTGLGVEFEQTRMILREPQLSCGAQHPMAFDATKIRDLYFDFPYMGSGKRQRRPHANPYIRRAANHLQLLLSR